MDFVLGNPNQPCGHAIVYFRSAGGGEAVFAAYLVIPPVPLNLARYMPPMMSAQLPAGEAQQVTVVPLPPLPEPVESYAYIMALAERRSDDLIDGGSYDEADVQRGMQLTAELAREYQQAYLRYQEREALPVTESASTEGVNAVIYALMSERQRLDELTRQVGKLRYAVDGNDQRAVGEVVAEMKTLGSLFSENYRISELIDTAQQPGLQYQKLSELWLERGYRLADEDYAVLQDLEQRIKALQEGKQPGNGPQPD